MKKKNEAVLSSFWGSTGLMLIAGGILLWDFSDIFRSWAYR